jgi:hypothetical protein
MLRTIFNINQSLSEEEFIYKQESIERIKAHLTTIFHSSGILSESQTDSLIDTKEGFFIDVSLSQSLLVTVCSVLPSPKGLIQVSYHQKRQKLMAKKGKLKPYEIKPNVINQHGDLLEQIQKTHPKLAKNLPISLIVLAKPIKLSSIPDTHCQRLGNEDYFYINGIYVVEESKLDNLMTALILSKPTSEHPTTSPSPKKTPLSKPVRPLTKPSSSSKTKTPKKNLQKGKKPEQLLAQPDNADTVSTSNHIAETTHLLSEAEQDELIRQRFPHIIQYITISSIFSRFFFTKRPQNISLFALYYLRTPYSQTQLKKTGAILSLGIREEAEYRLSSLLLEKMSRPGMNLYTHFSQTDELDEAEMPDIILYIPPDRVFIISVKSLVSTKNEPVKVFYDPAVDTLRS